MLFSTNRPFSANLWLLAAALVLAVAPLAAQTTIPYADGDDNTESHDTSAPNDPTTLSIASGSATQSGLLSGTGGIIKVGAGSLILGGANTYEGGTILNEGTLRLSGFGTFGDVDGTVTINGGTLGNAGIGEMAYFNNNVVVTSDFSTDSQGPGGALEIFGNVDLGAATTRSVTLTGEGLSCFGGSLTGQNLTLVTTASSSQAMFCSNTTNALTGTVRVGTGITLELEKVEEGVVAISGDLRIDSGATVRLNNVSQFAATSDVEVNGMLVGASAGTNAVDALTGSGTVTADQNDTLEVNSGNFTGTITQEAGNAFKLTKKSAGTLILTGTNTYIGATEIEGGTLIVDGSLHADSAVTVQAGGILAGGGRVGAVTVKSGGTISPGNSPGTLATSTETWEAGGTYLWEINDATGLKGTATDWLDIDGDLVLSTSSGTPFTIKVTSLTLGNVAGPAANFGAETGYDWILATAGTPILGFDPGHFALDTSGFANLPGSDRFTLSVDGNDLILSYTAVPEPGTVGFCFALMLLLLVIRRRRRIE